MPVVISGAAGFDTPRYIEMMLAQFGPDITGIVRVYDEEQFVVEADGMCHCRFVSDGSVSGNSLTMAFSNPGDCPGSEATPLILGDLVFEEPLVIDDQAGDQLTGSFIVEGGDRSSAQQVRFVRVRTWNQVGDDELLCDDPLVRALNGDVGGLE